MTVIFTNCVRSNACSRFAFEPLGENKYTPFCVNLDVADLDYIYGGCSVFLALRCQSNKYNVLHFIEQIPLMMYTMFKQFSSSIRYVVCTIFSIPSYTEIQQILSLIDIEVTCLKELLVTFGNRTRNKNSECVSYLVYVVCGSKKFASS